MNGVPIEKIWLSAESFDNSAIFHPLPDRRTDGPLADL
jgi:hypothetical protein